MTRRIVFIAGFAIFAMFFGAGNLIFPLSVGAHSGDHTGLAALGFLISGVLIPFLGLYVTVLYRGDYMRFMRTVGYWPGFVIAFCVLFLLCIVVATPRCGILAFSTFLPLIPALKAYGFIFYMIFFGLLYLACLKKEKVVGLLGAVLSPLKLGTIFLLMILGMVFKAHFIHFHVQGETIFWHALTLGYGTMDLLAAFFFGSFVYRYVVVKMHEADKPESHQRRVVLYASCLGALLIAVIYFCFIFVSHRYAGRLIHLPTAELVGALAHIIFGEYGGLFVALCVGLACFTTAIALSSVAIEFFYRHVFMKRLRYHTVTVAVVGVIFLISLLGFDRIMGFATPILSVLYPALLVLSVANIVRMKTNIAWLSYLFYPALLISIYFTIV